MTVADHIVVGEVGFVAWKSSAAFEDSYLQPDVIERVRHEFAVFPASTTGDVHLAEHDGTVVGWAARDGARDYISDVWISPASQGKGLGRALVDHVCTLISAEGHAVARIQTHARNVRAIGLYERHGFVIVWRGIEHSKSMGVELEKVHLEKKLHQG